MQHFRRASILIVLAGVALLGATACGGGGDSQSSGTPTGDAFDQAFIDAMVPHHESALEMAKAAKTAGLTQPDLIAVADAILATQQSEIDRMKEWRQEWFGSSEIDPDGAAALGLSDDEMGMSMAHGSESLLESGDVDTEFAQLMITHHNGAVAMAQLAESHAGHEELKQLAREIVTAQEREIAVMSKHASGMNHG